MYARDSWANYAKRIALIPARSSVIFALFASNCVQVQLQLCLYQHDQMHACGVVSKLVKAVVVYAVTLFRVLTNLNPCT